MSRETDRSSYYLEKSDQTDLATLMGLVSGTGIPAGSIGVPSIRAVEAFWPTALSRARVLLDLLGHLEVVRDKLLVKGEGSS